MAEIEVVNNPSIEMLDRMGVLDWPVWTKEVSVFSWHYDAKEICFFLDGDAIVTPEDGEPVNIGRGDLVSFAAGLSCTWDIHVAVRKRYTCA